MVRLAVLERVAEMADRLGRERFRPDRPQDVREIPADERTDVLKHLLGSGAHLRQTEVGIHRIHAEWRVLHEMTERVIRRAQFVFGPLALGDVPDDHHGADHALRFPNRRTV